MKTIGIIGGIAPESTIDYYRSIIAEYRARRPDGSYPPIVVNSIDMQRMLDLVASDLTALTEYLAAELQKLASAGAQCGLLASNTPHIVFEDVERRSPIPLVSIVRAARDAAKTATLTNLGLFGTRFTMEGGFFQRVFSDAGMTVIVPEPAEQDFIHDRYMNELVKGVFLPATRDELLAIVERMTSRANIDGLILAGTELPLILRGHETTIPFLDTTQIHVRAVLDAVM